MRCGGRDDLFGELVEVDVQISGDIVDLFLSPIETCVSAPCSDPGAKTFQGIHLTVIPRVRPGRVTRLAVVLVQSLATIEPLRQDRRRHPTQHRQHRHQPQGVAASISCHRSHSLPH
jgi:hypothetical protein